MFLLIVNFLTCNGNAKNYLLKCAAEKKINAAYTVPVDEIQYSYPINN